MKSSSGKAGRTNVRKTAYLDALESFVTHAQLLGDLVVVSSDGAQLLLDLGLAGGQVHVDDCQLIDAGLRLLEGKLDDALSAEGLETKNVLLSKYFRSLHK